MAAKVVFRRIRGRIIPIKQTTGNMPSEIERVVKVKRARRSMKRIKKPDSLMGVFLKSAQRDSKKVGRSIAKRIAKGKK